MELKRTRLKNIGESCRVMHNELNIMGCNWIAAAVGPEVAKSDECESSIRRSSYTYSTLHSDTHLQ